MLKFSKEGEKDHFTFVWSQSLDLDWTSELIDLDDDGCKADTVFPQSQNNDLQRGKAKVVPR